MPWKPRTRRLASELDASTFGRMILYDNLKPGILWVLDNRQRVNPATLAAEVAREYFLVSNLGGDAKRALQQVVREAVGDLLADNYVAKTPAGNIVRRRP